ncbi:Xaa-Pro dipeptidyl-peptidase [Saccharopolyspora sp. MS10]|uniref:Xaa-Pro dipeptidyl-peptidase n=1 Tax=Saccharopolyspora sp. MS10 TaxID=3385973 RepID=UPI0039A25321
MPTFLSPRRASGALLCATLVALPAPAVAAPEPAPPRSEPLLAGYPVRETVWVDTGLDGDGNGTTDRVAVDIARPRTDAPAPVIMDASPYYSCCGRGNESELKTYDEQGRPEGFPLFYDNYFVPRGYATVLVDLAGTNRSQGCADVGGPSDVTSARAVIDWLNGRAAGYDAATGGAEVGAGWATGDVGMIGKSYDGTIANGVAATGVEGLRTIVPIGAISSWYDYYRSDGVSFGANPSGLADTVEEGGRPGCEPVKQRLDEGAPASGDVTGLWTERDHAAGAGNVRASVFAVHGLNDLNVKTVQFGQWWDALARHDVRRKVWLSQTGHVDPFDFRRAEWVEVLHRWFDHELLGLDNGIDTEPAASVERAPDEWSDEPGWAGESAEATALHPVPGPAEGLGGISAAPAPPGARTAFTDDPRQDEHDWARHPDAASPARALFTSAPLAQDLRLAGTGSISVTASPATSSAHLSALLVDYGPATTRDHLGDGEGIRTLDSESCWGESREGDDACYRDTEATTTDVDYQVLSRGWADLANHASLSAETPLEPGTSYEMTFRLATTDHVIPAGHRLGLIIGGTDSAFIVAPDEPGRVELGLAGTSASLPVVGGPAAAAEAGLFAPAEGTAGVRPDRLPARPLVRLNGDGFAR